MPQTATIKPFDELVKEARSVIEEVQTQTLDTWLDQKEPMLLIDVREPEEYSRGSIPGSINIPRGLLELSIQPLVEASDQRIVLYCAGGGRSALAANSLNAMGYEAVSSLEGGFRAWMHD